MAYSVFGELAVSWLGRVVGVWRAVGLLLILDVYLLLIGHCRLGWGDQNLCHWSVRSRGAGAWTRAWVGTYGWCAKGRRPRLYAV